MRTNTNILKSISITLFSLLALTSQAAGGTIELSGSMGQTRPFCGT
jgi:hypothetical protein